LGRGGETLCKGQSPDHGQGKRGQRGFSPLKKKGEEASYSEKDVGYCPSSLEKKGVTWRKNPKRGWRERHYCDLRKKKRKKGQGIMTELGGGRGGSERSRAEKD